LRGRIEAFFVRSGGGSDAVPVVLAVVALCERLVCSAAETSARSIDVSPTLQAALTLAGSIGVSSLAPALRQVDAAGAAVAFRSILNALAQLQHLSHSDVGSVQRAAVSMLMELPPLFARLMDALEVPVQLVAWVRVAGELLLAPLSMTDTECGTGNSATRRWALRFCTRCVERCASALQPGGSEFPAWEVLSELSRIHEQRRVGGTTDPDWAADCDAWCRTLEGVAFMVSRHYPDQAREFALLASCTGSPLPSSLERLLLDAEGMGPDSPGEVINS